jgi:ornithine--oxo-acid transaminase
MCVRLKDHGLLAKPTHGDIIRLAPPLTINQSQMEEAVEIISNTMKSYQKK